jgi:GxxExxY protein
MEPIPEMTNRVSRAIVDAAFSVHEELGAGLLESVYERCLAHELQTRGHGVARQVFIPVVYRELRLDNALRIDLLVDDRLIVEIKAVDEIIPVHTAQLLTYLKLSRIRLGLLINFNVARIRDGIRRVAL